MLLLQRRDDLPRLRDDPRERRALEANASIPLNPQRRIEAALELRAARVREGEVLHRVLRLLPVLRVVLVVVRRIVVRARKQRRLDVVVRTDLEAISAARTMSAMTPGARKVSDSRLVVEGHVQRQRRDRQRSAEHREGRRETHDYLQ